MPIKKSELYSSLWKSCDELRGGMDASQYKDYVLVLLFVKYVSDKYAGQKDALLDVPVGGRFSDMVARLSIARSIFDSCWLKLTSLDRALRGPPKIRHSPVAWSVTIYVTQLYESVLQNAIRK